MIFGLRGEYRSEPVASAFIFDSHSVEDREHLSVEFDFRDASSGMLNWYDHPISTGPLEAANNKLKLLQRRAFGYRDLDFFKLKILSMHNCRFALVG